MHRRISLLLGSIVWLGTAASSSAADKCAALKAPIAGGKITSASRVPPPFEAPRFMDPAISERLIKEGMLDEINQQGQVQGTAKVPFCRVVGVFTPSPTSEINFEVWLPEQGYTGRFTGVGNGGAAGAIQYVSMTRMVNRGYAVFSTDRGHKGTRGEMDWAFDPQKVIDFRERATHLGAVLGKDLVTKYYGKPAAHSYFHGCSAGGMQAHAAALLHPEDFDGIVGGDWGGISYTNAPADFTKSRAGMWAGAAVPVPKLKMVTQAAVAACDTLDAVKDGFISDPRQCRFDPSKLACAKADGPDCLTREEVEALKTAYAGGAFPGSEYYMHVLRSGSRPVDEPKRAPPSPFGILTGPASPAQTYMKPFADRGGKFIAYSGLNSVLSVGMMKYQEEWIAELGRSGMSREAAIAEMGKTFRHFPTLGGEHCTGGPGATNISAIIQPLRPQMGAEDDIVSALEAWVEKGRAPVSIVATKYTADDPAKPVLMTRPLCPYPHYAKWNGKGDPNDHRSFKCVAEP